MPRDKPETPCPPSPSQQLQSDKANSAEAGRSWVFHRSRGQLLIPDADAPVINQIKFFLDRYRIKEAQAIFFDDDVLKLLGEEPDFMWDLIPLICKRLRGLCQYRFRVFEGCERMLNRIATDENCNPKELLISFLPAISDGDDNVFRALIRPLESALLRMNSPSPRDENLRWVINNLLRHIATIGLPQEYDPDSKKRPCSPECPYVIRYVEVLPLILNFIEAFMDQEVDSSTLPILTQSQIDVVFNGELMDDDSNTTLSRSSDASVTALMNLIYKPLTFLDMTHECSAIRFLGNRHLVKLLKLRANLFSPIYKQINDNSAVHNESESTSSTNKETIITLATCSYIYRCERMPITNLVPYFPQVITLESVLACHVPYVVGLIERNEVLVSEKGLALLENLTKYLEPDSLDQRFLSMFERSSLLQHIFQQTVFSPLDTNRRRAYDLFVRICDLFTTDCKFKLLIQTIKQTGLRACVRAACIDQYRRHLTAIYREALSVNTMLAEGDCEDRDDLVRTMGRLKAKYKQLGGQNLIDFLEQCIKTCLPDSQQTDIIENYELLLATLTIFRFLKLRKSVFSSETEGQYLTGQRLGKSFFEPIRGALAAIGKDMRETQKTSKDDEADCLSWALCRMDLIESILVRTCDLYNC